MSKVERPRLKIDPDAPQWAGPPVTCMECRQSGVPVWTQVGWTFPPHQLPMAVAIKQAKTWCAMSAEALPGQDQLPGPTLL